MVDVPPGDRLVERRCEACGDKFKRVANELPSTSNCLDCLIGNITGLREKPWHFYVNGISSDAYFKQGTDRVRVTWGVYIHEVGAWMCGVMADHTGNFVKAYVSKEDFRKVIGEEWNV